MFAVNKKLLPQQIKIMSFSNLKVTEKLLEVDEESPCSQGRDRGENLEGLRHPCDLNQHNMPNDK